MKFDEAISNLKKNLVRYNTDKPCDEKQLKFYINRNIEENLKSLINNNKFIMIQGVAGSGKTTIIKKVINELFCNSKIKKIFYRNIELNPSSKQNYIEDVYEKLIRDIFYNNKIRDDKLIKEFFIYFCKKEEMSIKQLDILNDINSINDTNKLCNSINKVPNNIFREYFWNDLTNTKNYKKYFTHLLNYFKYIMIIDNIDRLSNNNQIDLYKSLQDIASKILDDKSKIIFAIRNIRTWEVFGGGEAPENFDILDKIFRENDSFYKHRTPFIIIEKAINSMEKNDTYEYISEINKQIKKSKFIEFNIFEYSNGSIRTTFLNLLDFYIWFDKNKNSGSIVNFSQTKMNSLFLGWLSLQKHVNELDGLNLSKVIRNMEENNYKIVGCDTSLLLLTLIHNNPSGITYRRICNQFNKLNKSNKLKKELKEILFNMYSIGRHQSLEEADYLNHIISIDDNIPINEYDDIHADTTFYINLKGKQLLIASLTFTYNNLQYYKEFKHAEFNNYFKEKIETRIKANNLFLFRIIKVHLIELYRICAKYNTENWLEEYLLDFGYEIEGQRNLQVINIIGKTKKHLEYIKNDIEYYKEYDNELQNILNKYEEEVDNIYNNIKQEKYRILNFKKYFYEGVESYESIKDFVK